MTTTHAMTAPEDADRIAGFRTRREIISFFSGAPFQRTLGEVLHDDSLAKTIEFPPTVDTRAVLQDMRTDTGWEEERWRLDADGAVEMVSETLFVQLPAAERFSWSETLRKPNPKSYALRGLLSGLLSETVLQSFSEIHGAPIEFRSADIARYRPGHYLRRHDDLYDGRVFGLVFFIHDDWPADAGTRLVAEKPDGRCAVVEPRPSTVAVMRLAGDHFHQVEPNLSTDWDRYSLAVHFGETHA